MYRTPTVLHGTAVGGYYHRRGTVEGHFHPYRAVEGYCYHLPVPYNVKGHYPFVPYNRRQVGPTFAARAMSYRNRKFLISVHFSFFFFFKFVAATTPVFFFFKAAAALW